MNECGAEDMQNTKSEKKSTKEPQKKKNNNISRLIDIDILDFGGKIINEDLVLPHPRMHCRKFVLNPMKKIAPNWRHPIYQKKIHFLKYY